MFCVHLVMDQPQIGASGVVVLGPQSTYRGRGEIGGVYLSSQLEHKPQLCLWWKIDWKGKRVHPLPWPGWADFAIMMEYMPESGHCHSVCSLWHGPSITYKITPCWVTLLQQPGGAPCWDTPRVFGLIVCRSSFQAFHKLFSSFYGRHP